MEFILPILSASGEAVILILIVIVLFIIGRGRILPSEKTLVIERAGQYRMMLAPGLNLAQPFIETIARQLVEAETPDQGDQRLQFEVRDKEVASKNRPSYLLAISWHEGMLRFEAHSAPEDAAAQTAQTAGMPGVPGDGPWMKKVEETVRAVAQSWGVGLARLDHARTAIN